VAKLLIPRNVGECGCPGGLHLLGESRRRRCPRRTCGAVSTPGRRASRRGAETQRGRRLAGRVGRKPLPGFLGSRVLIGTRFETGVHAGTQEARKGKNPVARRQTSSPRLTPNDAVSPSPHSPHLRPFAVKSSLPAPRRSSASHRRRPTLLPCRAAQGGRRTDRGAIRSLPPLRLRVSARAIQPTILEGRPR